MGDEDAVKRCFAPSKEVYLFKRAESLVVERDIKRLSDSRK
jgi:hypothetical protein